jgi:hypothetical protein
MSWRAGIAPPSLRLTRLVELSGVDHIPMAGDQHAILDESEEVLVSSTVRDLVVGSGLAFTDAGLETLKGVPGEWR